GKPAVSAASPQDAINAYIKQRSAGFSELAFPGGFGFVATGSGTYEKQPNVISGRIAQRNAYLKAFMEAKRHLAEGLFGLTNEGKTKLAETLSTIDQGSSGTLINASERTSESISQRVDGMLRGFVVYDVFDDFDAGQVFVTIVTTPRTQGHFKRPDMDSISAASMREGLEQIVAEANKGLVPPVGGKTIFVPQTGELAFVGFGSAVVRKDNDKALQAKLDLGAERIARMRAADALCGIIMGDSMTARSKLDSEVSGMVQDYDAMAKNDPTAAKDPNAPAFQQLEQRKKEFSATESASADISSIRKGVMPAGVQTQSWFDGDRYFVYGMAIYLPSATARASGAAKSMQQGRIIQQPDADARGMQPGANQPDAGTLKQGPSGQVQSNDAL
ncbi:MAG: hypothetical protein FWG59_02255, partial [Betaproteobacteria bacterium]|nr:hypothetical protein [Betaproteobacteria bacterium]